MLALVMTVTVIPTFTQSVSADSVTVVAEVSYEFETQDRGYADGAITVSSNTEGVYYFYWGDANGNKLSAGGVNYSYLGWCDTTYNTQTEQYVGTYRVISDYTAIPEGAKMVLAYHDNAKVGQRNLPAEKLFNEGTATNTFGLISDIHYNRYDDSGSDDAIYAFNNALNFFDKTGIGFVAVTGDISRNSETDAFEKYHAAVSKHSKIKVYSILGNHDVYNSEAYKKYVVSDIKAKNAKKKGILSVGENGLDFVYERNGDIFIFFNQVRWAYNSSTSYLVTQDQLNWLEKTLNTYANRDVYLMFHSYFASENGDVTTAVGNLVNPGGYTYDLTYTFGCADEKRFRKLLNKYQNVTVFSGHSHWQYAMQIYNDKLNIGNIKSDNSGATLVHVSSVTDPRSIRESAKERTELNNKASEGMIATVYKNCTVYTGVDFWNGEYLAYATYVNQKGKKTTPVAAVKVKKAKISSAKRTTAKKAKIKIKKMAGVVGYQIKYSTTKKFKKSQTKTKTTKKTTYVISKLKAKKVYYVRVRAYKKQFGYKVYGKWSNTKRIKVKK